MFKSTKDFDSAIEEILTSVRDEKGIDSDNSSLIEDDFLEAVAECIDRKYLIGASYDRMSDGKPRFSVHNTRITYSGLSFLESRQ